MKNLIIIGASGLIGSHILKKINNEEMKVIAVSANLSDFQEILDSDNILYEGYQDFKKRVNDNEDLKEYIVLNLAYPRLEDREVIEDAINFTYKITEDIKHLGVTKYIYVSTQSVYDENRLEAAKEGFMLKPKTFYGEGKVIVEEYLKEYSKNHNIELSILRLGSVVGPGMDKRITTRFVKTAIESMSITVFDSGQEFSFIHLEDVIDVLVLYIEYISSNQSVGILNVGTNETYSLVTIANEIKEQLKTHKIDVMVNVEKQEGEYKNNAINVDKLYLTLNWEPKYQLKDIIKNEIKGQLKP